MEGSLFLYNSLLHLGSLVASPYLLYKLATTAKYRQNLAQRLGRLPTVVLTSRTDREWLWLHAVSVGEVMAAIPILQGLRRRYPNFKLLISTVTLTGHQTAQEKIPWADAHIYYPFDYPWIVKRVLGRIRPRLFLTMETEFWPNFFYYLARNGIPAAIINGRISPRSYRNYSYIKFFMKRVFQWVTLFGMQTELDARRICALGAPAERVKVMGNVKFDQAIASASTITPEQRASLLETLRLPCRDAFIIIAGSTHRGEEEIILDIFQGLKSYHPHLYLILAPRHIDRTAEIEELIEKRGLVGFRRSRLDRPLLPSETLPPHSVIILDTLGELATIYAVATLVFVGGSLVPTGGQNMLEPAVHGKPVLFGPSVYNFQEISQMLKESGGGIQVRDKQELACKMAELLQQPERIAHLGKKAREVVYTHRGAVERNLELIGALLEGIGSNQNEFKR